MNLYFLRRLSLLIVTLMVLSLASYWLAHIFPGDPVVNLSGRSNTTPEEYKQLVEYYYLNKSAFSQYLRYLELLWQGDWGTSFTSEQPLFDEVRLLLPASIELGSYALLISLLVGIPMGFIAGLNHGKFSDATLLGINLIGYSIPVFWLALLLILFFSLQLGWFPISGRISLLYEIPNNTGFIIYDILTADIPNKRAALVDALGHMLLPTISISIVTSTIIMKTTRRSVINVMSSDYIRAAYAKGLTNSQVFFKHGLRNALLPIMPQIAMQFTTLLTNAMIVETIFSWPGIGNWLIQAIYQQDYPAIRAGMLSVASLVVIFTVCIDVLHKLIDPQRMYFKRVKN
ncbi:ABC transporter permease [Paraneptunicella aestuarii]|uniref:ABC transporter permease n=1 Tax=Paraneptunicella aestuarii TaxID=2831148 RepID=UPI001E4A48AD|nr:ABC transporter permease [Paraneptunicella aestuarii]UAA37791.1 ABC transporter permease [Paraneptunicella aestuarii]